MENTFLNSIPVAHRGLHGGNIPENSYPAFEAAVQAGYAVEMDVRPTKDNVLVVFHDETLLRVTGTNKKVIDCTWEQLQAERLEGTEERIPRFSEFLQFLAGRVPLLLEIKNVPEVDTYEFLRHISEELEGYPGEIAMQSFQPAYVKAFKRIRPGIPSGILATASSTKEDFGNSPLWKIKAYAVKHMSLNFSVKPDFVSYHFSDLPRREVSAFKGIKLAWTIRSEQDEAYARKYADNIIFENYIPKK